MFAVVVRGALVRRARFVLTATAVLLAAAFVSGTLVLAQSVRHSYDALIAQVTSRVDVYVRGPETDRHQGISDFAPVPAPLLERVRALPEVAAAQGQIVRRGQLVAPDGTFLGTSGRQTYCYSWPAFDRLSAFSIATGRAPRAPGEIAIDSATAAADHLAVGDAVRVSIDIASPARAVVVGLADPRQGGDLTAASAVFVDEGWAQTVTGVGDGWDLLETAAATGIGPDELRARIAAVLPGDGTTAITSREYADAQVQNLTRRSDSVTALLLAIGALAVLAGAAVLVTTVGVVVEQRRRELGLLRTIGYTRLQVYLSIVGETAAVGLLASAAGALLGIPAALALRALVALAGEDASAAELRVEPLTLVLVALGGTLVAAVLATWPALRATRVAPVEAMREVDATSEAAARPRRRALGPAVAAAGVALVAGGLLGPRSSRLPLVASGGALAVLALLACFPVLAPPVVRALGLIVGRTGAAGAVARTASARSPRRAAIPAASLVLGLGLITCVSVLASSSRASITGLVQRTDRADLVIDSDAAPGVDPEAIVKVREAPGVAAVAQVGAESFTVDDGSALVSAIDPTTAAQVLSLPVVAGSLDALVDGGIAVSQSAAESGGYHVGQVVTARFGEPQVRQLRIVAELRDNGITRDWVIPFDTYGRGYHIAVIRTAFVKAAADTSALELRRQVTAGVAGFPGVQVRDPAAYASAQADQVAQPVALIEALVAFAIVIGLLGVMNTLGLAVVERGRELALLRIVGMTRLQVAATVEWEAAIIAALGVTVGLAAGGLLGVVLVLALATHGVTELVVPVARLAVIASLVVVAALVAAVIPASRAARVGSTATLARR